MSAARILFLFFAFAGLVGCANIVTPTGGERDTKPPELISIVPADSSLNIRPQKLELRFNEYVQLGDLSALQISPLTPTPLTATADRRRVIVRIPDTALQTNTTYNIRFGEAVQDLNEGNPFGDFSYTFSTGLYFDSLRLTGRVLNAATGLSDGEATLLLYPASSDDTAVLRSKPLYTTKASGDGSYTFQNLPAKAFRIYAVADKNNNLTADGGERVAFIDTVVIPADSALPLPLLRTFLEQDTATTDTSSATANAASSDAAFGRRSGVEAAPAIGSKSRAFAYTVGIDTTDAKARVDLLDSVRITFTAPLDTLVSARVFLSYDSAGATLESVLRLSLDTATRRTAILSAAWQPDVAYTLRLLKGFARDTAGTEAGPARYRFRTKREEDYGKLIIRIPSRFYGRGFVLQVQNENDTIYTAPVTDSTVRLARLRPGNIQLRIIADANRNGRWDAGNLLAHKQPEWVYPHDAPVPVKGGWDAEVTFETADDQTRRSRIQGERFGK